MISWDSQITLGVSLYRCPFLLPVPQLHYTTTSICRWWDQIELNVWLAFSCQESVRQSWIPGAMSQFPLFTGLDGRSLLNWANKTDSVHKQSLCLLCRLTDCHFCCCYNLGNCISPWRNVGRVGASRVQKKTEKVRNKRELQSPGHFIYFALKKIYTGLYWNSSALFEIIKCVTLLGTQRIL